MSVSSSQRYVTVLLLYIRHSLLFSLHTGIEKTSTSACEWHLHADVEAFQTVLGTKEIAND